MFSKHSEQEINITEVRKCKLAALESITLSTFSLSGIVTVTKLFTFKIVVVLVFLSVTVTKNLPLAFQGFAHCPMLHCLIFFYAIVIIYFPKILTFLYQLVVCLLHGLSTS